MLLRIPIQLQQNKGPQKLNPKYQFITMTNPQQVKRTIIQTVNISKGIRVTAFDGSVWNVGTGAAPIYLNNWGFGS